MASSSTSPSRAYHQREGSGQVRQRKTSLGQRSLQATAGSSVLVAAASGSSARQQSSHLTSTASSVSSARRHLLFGTDDRIVLDIGSRVTKIGFSGESRPREIFWSMEEAEGSQKDPLLWSIDFARCETTEERKLKEIQLRARLTSLLRNVFYKRLMVDPKQRKVIIVENAFMPTLIKGVMCDVLFGNLQVPSICFVPSHLLSTLAIGRTSSIVIDVGYEEATLLPIYYGRALAPLHLLTSPRAGKCLAARLRAMLLHFAIFIPQPSLGSFTSGAMTTGPRSKPPAELLTDAFLDEIKAKALFVGDSISPTGEPIVLQLAENFPNWSAVLSSSKLDEPSYETVIRLLEKRYRNTSRAKDMVIGIPLPPPGPPSPATQPSTMGAPSPAATVGRGSLIIPGWVRERAAEVLFEGGDEEELSIVDMILTTLVKLPIDVRIALANHIYLVGGTSMLPGFAHRVRVEIVKHLLDAKQMKVERSAPNVALASPRPGPTTGSLNEAITQRQSPKNHSDRGSAGLSSEGQLLMQESTPMEERRRRKIQFTLAPVSSLAPHIAVLNDHAPRIDVNGDPVGGMAPSFPVNLSSWIGASMMGSLRVETSSQKSREAWDEEQEARLAAAKAAVKRKDGDARPAMGLGRGSFLGTVGGLDLGTYGPLSSGTRGSFSHTSPRSPSSSTGKS